MQYKTFFVIFAEILKGFRWINKDCLARSRITDIFNLVCLLVNLDC